MKIRTLDVVEDSNEFFVDELEGLPLVTPYTIGGKERKIAGQVVALARVDRFPKGAEVDVPTRQAEHLIALGLAELVPA